MTAPLAKLGTFTGEQFPVRCYFATVTAVDTTAHECNVDIGDGAPLSSVVYFGAAPQVGAQVLYLTFGNNAVVLGGTG